MPATPDTSLVTRDVHTLSQAGAENLLSAVVAAARERSLSVSVAVHDLGANLLGFLRMDGAPPLTTEIAQNKSYSAAAFGMPTHQWHEAIKDDEPLKLSMVHTPRLVTFGGGYPVVSNERILGGLGLSGGHYTQDMEVAEAALSACGFTA